MVMFLSIIKFSSVILLSLIVIAPLFINSLASLLEVQIELLTSKSNILHSLNSNVGTPLKPIKISSFVKLEIFPLNKDLLILTALSNSSLPCKNVITSLAKAM